MFYACSQNPSIEASDFVFSTENVEGDEAYYSKPAVITGHIANREVYPNTKDVSITIPFYDRVDTKQTSVIYEDRFAFSLVPYAPRTISMEPFVEHMMVCPGTKQELPYLQELAAAYQGKPLRIVNFYIDQGTDVVNSLDIETYHLTDEQRLGLDPILHLGAGIPFYILIDKDGVIVDFGEHLRPSIPETRDIIDTYIDYK